VGGPSLLVDEILPSGSCVITELAQCLSPTFQSHPSTAVGSREGYAKTRHGKRGMAQSHRKVGKFDWSLFALSGGFLPSTPLQAPGSVIYHLITQRSSAGVYKFDSLHQTSTTQQLRPFACMWDTQLRYSMACFFGRWWRIPCLLGPVLEKCSRNNDRWQSG
jgi:hypothetical protein